jgi:alpha-tubulin suppressor-like RCC1 family protein
MHRNPANTDVLARIVSIGQNPLTVWRRCCRERHAMQPQAPGIRDRRAATRPVAALAIAALALTALALAAAPAAAQSGAQSGSQTFSYTGSPQYFTVPAGVTSIEVQMWGGGGGGGYYAVSAGGAGAYVDGHLSVTPGEQLTILVGGGGSGGSSGAGQGGYGGGGLAGGSGGSGGGRSAIATYTTGLDIISAGGGGGGSALPNEPGGSGGIGAGMSGTGTAAGGGGSQSAGGSGGTGGGGAGSKYNGGIGYQYGGGGGGGLFGGGGGNGAGGGGGSSLTSNINFTVANTEAGNGILPGGALATNYDYKDGVGIGGTVGPGGNGGNGEVVVSWLNVTVPSAVSGTNPTSFTYTAGLQFFTVPAGVSTLNVQAWGGGGGGVSGSLAAGGGAAYVSGTLTVVPGQVLTVLVGGGGAGGTNGSGAGGYGGGGSSASANAGGGGGESALADCLTGAMLVEAAGGGGGGSGTLTPGGAGGIETGSIGTPAAGGGGGGGGAGSQTAGGAAGAGSGAAGGNAGYAHAGGAGGAVYGGGGGGGGYYGGGGGGGAFSGQGTQGGSGGGGSSYTSASTFTLTSAAQGRGSIPGGNLVSTYIAGVGVGGSTAPGGNGLVVISWSQAAPPAGMRAWGSNGAGAGGELGTGSPGISLAFGATPTRVKASAGGDALTNVVQQACGYTHTLALRGDGTVWAWGANESGQLGNNTTTAAALPVQVLNPSGTGPLQNVVMVAAGSSFSMAVVSTSSGETIYTWGANGSGQLGVNSIANSTLPVQAYFTTTPNSILSIACGQAHSLACTTSGILAWGDNTYGQLGTGLADGRHLTPALIPSRANYYTSVSAGAYFSAAVGISGDNKYSVYVAGADDRGEMGDGGGSSIATFTPITLPTTAPMGIACGQNFCLANVLAVDPGEVYAWGDNTYGQLGTGSTGGILTPTLVPTYSRNPIVEAAAGNGFSMLLDTVGNVWAAGANGDGQLGQSSTAAASSGSFLLVSNLTGVSAISAGAAFGTALTNEFKFVWEDSANGVLPVWEFANPDNALLNTSQGFITGSNPYASYGLVTAVDLFGDGNRDLLMQNSTTGALAYIRLQGTNVVGQGQIPASPSYDPAWRVVGTMNINNKLALVWQNSTTGMVYYWTMGVSGGVPTSTGGGLIYNPGSTTWQVAAAYSYGGSNFIIWHDVNPKDPNYGLVIYWNLGGVSLPVTNGNKVPNGAISYASGTPFVVPTGWTLHVDDIDGDGNADFVWHNNNGLTDPQSGETYIWLMSAPNPVFSSALDVPGLAPNQIVIPVAYYIGGIL